MRTLEIISDYTQVSDFIDLSGAPGGSRTPDQQDRNLLLYPAELLAHIAQP